MNLLVMNLTVSAVEKNPQESQLRSWDPMAGQERLAGAGGMEQPWGHRGGAPAARLPTQPHEDLGMAGVGGKNVTKGAQAGWVTATWWPGLP